MKPAKMFTTVIGLVLGLLLSSTVFAQIGFWSTIGATSSKTTGTSINISVPNFVNAGYSIIISFAMDPVTGAVSCTDSGSNSYTVDADVTNGSGTSGVRTVVLSAHNINLLSNNSTITCSHPSVGARAISAISFVGLATTSTVDRVASSIGSGTSPSSGNTAITTQGDELLLGVIGVEGPNGDTFTAGANYSFVASGRASTSGGSATTNVTVNPEFRIVSATGQYAATATLGTSRQWAAAIATYKGKKKLAITSINGGTNPTAGSPFNIIVQSQTDSGTPINVLTDTGVSLSLKTGTGTLGGTLSGTILAGTNQITINGATYTKAQSGIVLTATRTSGDSLSPGDSAGFTVDPGPPSQIGFSTQPGASIVGSPIAGPPTVAVQDSLGNTVTATNAAITVAIGANPGGGTLSGTLTKNTISGAASFNDLTINQLGNGYTLTASASGYTNVTSSAFNLTPSSINLSLVRTIGTNSSKTTGTSISVPAPGGGGVAAGNSIIVALAMDPVSGSISCNDSVFNNYTVNSDVINGSGSSGVRTVIISAHNVNSLTSGQGITCNHPSLGARAMSAFEFSGLATASSFDKTASSTGSSTAPSSGNTQATAQAVELLFGAIGVEGPSGDAFTAGANYTAPADGRAGTSGGGATTNITINPEYRFVTATGAYAATGTLGTSRSWGAAIATYKAKVTPKFAITSVHGGANPTAGQPFSVVVQSQTADGLPILVANATSFTLSVHMGAGNLSGTTSGTISAGSYQTTVNGVIYSKAEPGVVLRATQSSGDAVTSGNSVSFTVNADSPTKLVFIHQPTNSTTSGAIKGPPTVAVQDNVGNTITTSTAAITIAMGTNPGGGTLSGTTVKNAAGGTAAFADLHINNAANGYTLTATSPSLTSATTDAFTISAAGNVAGTVTKSGGGGAISGALVSALQSGVVKGTGSTNSSGNYTITGLVPGTYDIRGTAGGFTPQTQTGVTVSSGATATANFSLAVATATAGIVYIYDDLQRLKAVIDPIGEAATYSYDAVGNLLGITRNNASQTSVIDFNPNSGPVGSTVTIHGTGYSATPSQNIVTFNGVAASVVSSTLTQIVATVPAGATTGVIAVTSPAGSASSSASFTVTGSSAGAPTVAGFTPTSGTAGTSITINGTNFNTTPANNDVTINGSLAQVTGATSTSLTVTVPAGASSGKIAVTTSSGTAISSQDFVVPPSPFSVASVESSQRITINGASVTTTVSTAGKIALALFDGTAGQIVELGINNTNLAANQAQYFIYGPGGIDMFVQSVFVANPKLVLSTTGTYTIVFDPLDSNTGFATWTLSTPVNGGVVTLDGPSVFGETTRVGQTVRFTFSGNAGQFMSLGVVTSGGMGFGDFYIYRPDGVQFYSTLTVGTGTNPHMTLPMTGTYTMVADPDGNGLGGITLTLSSEVNAGETFVDGASGIVNLPRYGQRGRIVFNNSVSNRIVSFAPDNITTSGVFYSITDPANNVLADGSQFGTNTNHHMLLQNTGIHTILLYPGIGTFTLLLSTEVDAGPITINGAPALVTTSRVGQRAKVTFNGTQGQLVTVRFNNNTAGWFYPSLVKPDGTTLVSDFTQATNFNLPQQTLPVDGTYTIYFDPTYNTTGSVSISVTNP